MKKRVFIFVLWFVFMVDFNGLAEQANQIKMKEAESYFEKSKASLKSGDADKAVEYAEKAISLRNNVAMYYLCLGDAYVLKISKLPELEKFQYIEKVKEAYENAAKLDGKNVAIRLRLTNFYIQAPSMAGGDLGKAKANAAEVLKSDQLLGNLIFSIIYLREDDMINGEKSVTAAYKLHLEAQKKNPGKITGFNVNILNDYGYYFLSRNKIEKAIKFFEMNVEAFPKHFNTYDSLAEAYKIKGDKELAIKYYEKSVALNPRKNDFEKRIYKDAVEMLKNLKKK
jgi:tetratricopeptide (TPR) repeat protein